MLYFCSGDRAYHQNRRSCVEGQRRRDAEGGVSPWDDTFAQCRRTGDLSLLLNTGGGSGSAIWYGMGNKGQEMQFDFHQKSARCRRNFSGARNGGGGLKKGFFRGHGEVCRLTSLEPAKRLIILKPARTQEGRITSGLSRLLRLWWGVIGWWSITLRASLASDPPPQFEYIRFLFSSQWRQKACFMSLGPATYGELELAM